MLSYPQRLCNVAARVATVSAAALFSGCIGDLPREEFPCLMANDLYNKYNETYVFSPQGKKREAMVLIREIEAACVRGELPDDAPPRS